MGTQGGAAPGGPTRPINPANIYPGQDHYPQSPHSTLSRPRGKSNTTMDPFSDDPIDTSQSQRGADPKSGYIVSPSITVRPEFSSLTRSSDATQPLSCIVVIELPGKRLPGVPGPAMPSMNDYNSHSPNHSSSQSRRDTSQSGSPTGGSSPYMQSNALSPGRHSPQGSPANPDLQGPDPFASITADLRARIVDWKGHPLSDLGPLQMYDLLSVRRDNLVREFYVYLFKEALICVVEEKKRGLGRLLSNASSTNSGASASDPYAPRPETTNKGVLRLKGRIYVRHVKHVTASSAAGEMSLTIDMEDELASFILIFKERDALENWRRCIENLVHSIRGTPPQPAPGASANAMGMEGLLFNLNFLTWH